MNFTAEQRRKHFETAVLYCTLKGWKHIEGWIFRAPSGTYHDLSASDLKQLERIEREGLSLVDAEGSL